MTTEHPPDVHPGHVPGPGYETRDASVPSLLSFGVGLIIAIVVIQLLMLGFYHRFVKERPKEVAEKATENLYQQLRDLHRNEAEALGSYGWVDRKEGVVRIPIERAIDVVAEKGVRFGKGPKSELEMNSHAGTPVTGKETKNPPESTEPKP